MPKQPQPPPPPASARAMASVASKQARSTTPQPTSTSAHRPQEHKPLQQPQQPQQPQHHKDSSREGEDETPAVHRDQSRGSATSPAATPKKKRQTLSDFRIPVPFGARKPKARTAEPTATPRQSTSQEHQPQLQQEQQQWVREQGHNESDAQQPSPQQQQQQQDSLHHQRQRMHKQLVQYVSRRSRSRGQRSKHLDSPRAPSEDLRAVGPAKASHGRRRNSVSPPASPRVAPRRIAVADDSNLPRSHSHTDLESEHHRRLKEMPHKISQMMRRGMKRLDGRDVGRGFFNRFKRKADKEGEPDSASDSERGNDDDDGDGRYGGAVVAVDPAVEATARGVRLPAEERGDAGRYDNDVDAVVVDRTPQETDVRQRSRTRTRTDASVGGYEEDTEDSEPDASLDKPGASTTSKKHKGRRSFMSFTHGRKKESVRPGSESDSEDSADDAGDGAEHKRQKHKKKRKGQGRNALVRLSGVREASQETKDDDDEERGRERSEAGKRGHGDMRGHKGRKSDAAAAAAAAAAAEAEQEDDEDDEDDDGISEDGDEDEDDYDDEDLEDPDQTDNIELRKLAAEANRIRQEKEEKEEKMTKLDRALENLSSNKTEKSSKEANKYKKQRERYKKQISEFESRLKDIKEEKKKVATGGKKPFFDRAAERLQQGVSRFITRTLHESNSDHGSHDAPKIRLTPAPDAEQQPSPPPEGANAEEGVGRQRSRSEDIGGGDTAPGDGDRDQKRASTAEAVAAAAEEENTAAKQQRRVAPHRHRSVSPSLGDDASSEPQSPAAFRRTATAASPGRPRNSVDAGRGRHRNSAAISTPARADADSSGGGGGGLRGNRAAAGMSMPPLSTTPRRGTSDSEWGAAQTGHNTRARMRSTATSSLAGATPGGGAQRSRPHTMAITGNVDATAQSNSRAPPSAPGTPGLSSSANAGMAGPRTPRKPHRTASGPAKTAEAVEEQQQQQQQQQQRLRARRRRTEEDVGGVNDVLVEEDEGPDGGGRQDVRAGDGTVAEARAASVEQTRQAHRRPDDREYEDGRSGGGSSAVRIRAEADDVIDTDGNRSDDVTAGGAGMRVGRGRGDGRAGVRQGRRRQVSQESRSVSSERIRGPAMSPSPSPSWDDELPASKRRSQTLSQDRSGHLVPPSPYSRPRSMQGQTAPEERDDRSQRKRFGSWMEGSEPAEADFEVRHGEPYTSEDGIPTRRRRGPRQEGSHQARQASDASMLLGKSAPRVNKHGDVRAREAANTASESEQSVRSTPGRRGERDKAPLAAHRQGRSGVAVAGDEDGADEEPYDSDASSRSRGKDRRGKRRAGGGGWKEPRPVSEPAMEEEMPTPSAKRKDKKRSKFDPRRYLPGNVPKHSGEEKKKRFGKPSLRQASSSGRKGLDKAPIPPSDRASPTSSLSSDRDLALQQGAGSPAFPLDELNRWKAECAHLENENAELAHHIRQLRSRLSQSVKMHDDRYLAWERRLEQERGQLAELVRDYHEMLSGKLHDNARGIARLQQSIATVEDSSASFMRDLRSTQRSVKEYLDHMKRIDEPVAAAADRLAPQVVTLLAIWDSYKDSLIMAAGAVGLVLVLWLFAGFVPGFSRAAS